ncbi:holo-ACP synthase [Flocculibacter collagenilyticus]|uniref:holo-ACP synthase n=1 Tax=Flocculibacter collagenilyticus TaxID=2744479 RepID=UPI0018F3E9E3|nr:holo-ACP synthase [Flocculibacter collagenilyticus]
MPIMGIGTDIIEIQRVETQLERGSRLAKRVLTERELVDFEAHNQPARFLAKRFAAKEAAAKAMGTGIGRGISFQHFEISHDESGRPLLVLSGNAEQRAKECGITATHISISDEQHYATAVVILES